SASAGHADRAARARARAAATDRAARAGRSGRAGGGTAASAPTGNGPACAAAGTATGRAAAATRDGGARHEHAAPEENTLDPGHESSQGWPAGPWCREPDQRLNENRDSYPTVTTGSQKPPKQKPEQHCALLVQAPLIGVQLVAGVPQLPAVQL